MIDSYAESLRRSWGSSPSDPRNAGDFLPLGRIAAKDWSNSRVIERLLLYERRLENSLYRTIAKLRAVQLMRQIDRSNAAQTQTPAQAVSRANSAKQSQFPLDPKEISDFLEETYGDNPPLWAQATLRRLDGSLDADSSSPDRRRPIPGRRTHGNGEKRSIPLSLLRL